MARTPVRITDLSTDTAQVINTTPASTTYGLVVRAVGGSFPGTTAVRVTNTSTQAVPVGGTLLQDIKRSVTDFETRLDYSTRADSNPVYVGKNLNAASTSANTWTIQRLTYDSSARLTRAQVLSSVAWSSRNNLGW